MKISACYIVRNEAATIERSIASIYKSIDELLVIDTGSTDDTVAIAARCGAKVLKYHWQEDFSQARNFAIDAATGDWIIFLDADEFFTQDTLQNLRQVIQKHQQADALLVQRTDIDADQADKILGVLFVLRMFPRRKDLRFVGRIHEELRIAGAMIEQPVFVPSEELRLMHTGYSTLLNRAKAERNLQLLQQELAETKEPERLYGYLADAWLGVNDTVQAMKYARLDVAQGRRPVTYASRSYRILLQLLAQNPNLYQERLQMAAHAAADFPELAEMHAEYAECLAYNFQYEEALKEGNEAIRLSHKKLAVEASLFCTEQAELLHDRLRLWQEICRRSMSVKLSACVIVKNEAGEIRRWLENVKAYCDEIILVDTGSTDATRQIAESAGAQIFEFAWNGDFSAARNFMIAKASGDWIISPDADEYFIQPEKIRFFMAEVDVMQPKVDAVMVTSSNIDADYGNQEINRYPVVRIFRRRQELRYVGNIHECLWRPDGELNVFMEKSRILLLHTGYSTGRIMKKTHRDLAMLLQDIQKNGEGEQHYAYLASCYFGLQEYEKSLHYAQLAIQAKIQGVGVTSELYHETIISLIHLHRPLAEQLAMARRGVQRFPLLPDFYAYEGDMLCALRRIPEGEQALERARDLFEHPRDSSGEATMARNIMGSVYSRLGKIYQRNGRMQESKEACRQALQLRPYQTDFLLEYIEMQQDQTPEALAAALSEIYSNTPLHQEYLRRWAEQYGFVQLSRCYAAQLPTASELWKKVEQGYGLAQQQRFEELKDSVLQRVGQVLPLFFLGLLDLAALPQGTGNLLLEHSRSLLPKGLQRVLERYTCDDKELSAAEFDSYVSMLEVVANSGTPLQVHRYLQIALDFSWADVYRIAQQLLRGEHWQEAMTLYAAIPEDVSVVTAMFWQEVGICFFQLHQLEAAEESLRRAQQMGAANKEIEAYLCWIGKAASHD